MTTSFALRPSRVVQVRRQTAMPMIKSFFVQKGMIEFTVGEKTIQAEPGQFVKVLRGEIHSFRNLTNEEAETLILNVPGYIRDNVFHCPSSGFLAPEVA